jgi:hypothetical protein
MDVRKIVLLESAIEPERSPGGIYLRDDGRKWMMMQGREKKEQHRIAARRIQSRAGEKKKGRCVAELKVKSRKMENTSSGTEGCETDKNSKFGERTLLATQVSAPNQQAEAAAGSGPCLRAVE